MPSKWITIALSLIFALSAHAAESAKPAFTDPDTAGIDFQIQGEYTGQLPDGSKLAAQVIADGSGSFAAIFLPGGLPGDGCNGKYLAEVAGKLDGKSVAFAGSNYAATSNGELLAGQNDKGQKFTLRKTLRHSPTEGAKPPASAIVLFDGSKSDELDNPKLDDRKFLVAGVTTKRAFADFTLHLEYILPFMPEARGQARANSGVYIQRRYEIQILDSFGLVSAKNNDCAAVYTRTAPSLNMCYPPLSWQTYDIDFTAARWDADGKKTANAVVTVKHNGVVVHDKVQIASKTGSGQPESPQSGPINFQYHNNPVFFRNIWIVGK
jgi:hypothetical protein